MGGWIDTLKSHPIPELAKTLELEVIGRNVRPCPACGARQRSKKDKRPPVAFSSRGEVDLWRCLSCDAGGSALDLVAFCLCGHRYNHQQDHETIREWMGDDIETPAARQISTAIVRPPLSEVVRLWESSWRLDQMRPWGKREAADLPMVEWLRRRNQSEQDTDRRFWKEPPDHYENRSPLAELGSLDVVRVLPPSGAFQNWPQWWKIHYQNRWRLACLAFEPSGLVGSIHVRSVIDDGQDSKTRWPSAGPGSASGLILAGKKGAAWLKGEVGAPIVWLLEGLTDLCAAELVCHREGLDDVVCLSAAAGGFSAFGKIKRWEDECLIYVRTDPDAVGEKYFQKIVAAIPRSCRLFRLPWDIRSDNGRAGEDEGGP